MSQGILVIQVAALGARALRRHLDRSTFDGLVIRSAESVFPAVTCTFQASFRTASPPAAHGMVFNGHHDRRLRHPAFWEQSSALVEGPRLWQAFRKRGKRVGMLFWQQSLGEEVDLLLSPWPIHTHGGGLVDVVHSKPAGLAEDLAGVIGHPFQLHRYWGPLASRASSDWIVAATDTLLQMPELRPELLLTYLPHLDYALQRHGPSSRAAGRAFAELLPMLRRLQRRARRVDYEILVVGDYAIDDATAPLFPNRTLRRAGLLQTRDVRGRAYPNFHESRAFAVVDHEVAHVYVPNERDIDFTAAALEDDEGRYRVLRRDDMRERSIDHQRAGELLLEAKPGYWFAYPWWTEAREAPDYAGHVDIHNKPGFDPCELFFGWPPPLVSQRPERIRGTHGSNTAGREVAWWSTLDFEQEPKNIIDIAKSLGTILESQ